MKLESVNFKGFRSILDVTLLRCGGFNVLIGKNNAGKSNVLQAIYAFFECIRKGEPINISPPAGRVIDHHKRNTAHPIELTHTFQLSSEDRQTLISDVSQETPQMKNAIESLEPELTLQIAVVIVAKPDPFAYVRQISLRPSSGGDEKSETILLRINEETALELFEKAKLARSKDEEADVLRRFPDNLARFADADMYTRVRTEGISKYMGYFMREAGVSRDLANRIDSLARAADTIGAFNDSLKQGALSAAKEAAEVRSTPLKRTRVDGFSGQQNQIPTFALKMLRRVASLRVIYLTERREPIGRKEAGQLLELKVKRGGPEKLRAIQDTVSALLGVEIDAFRGDESDSNAELDVDQFLVQANGAGIREALRLILDHEFERPDILLVEEPEIHLHPALETSMLRYLKKVGTQSQVFITTHSTNFLDTAEMRNVYLTTQQGSTEVDLIDAAEAEAAIPKELGIRLSSVFMFDRLIFVEGPSDEEIIREWASILGINLSQACVGFVPMGGVRNLAHFATEKTMAFLTKRQVKMWFLIDRDEKDDPEIQKLKSGLAEQAELVILARRELENYLLVPSVVAKFIALKRQLAGIAEKSPTPSEVEAAMLKCVEDLKTQAIERRVTKRAFLPVYPDRNALLAQKAGVEFAERARNEFVRMKKDLTLAETNLTATIEHETKLINTSWNSRKLEIVPGDVLLDKVCQEFKVRFIKERDSQRCAAVFLEREIPEELKDFLSSITK